MYLEISNPMDYHVAFYIRLSKEDETEGPSQSVTNQKSLLNEFVQQHRLSVYDTYVDDGWSGTSFERPDFQRMIGDIEAKKVNMVITKDLSRLGRDYIMTGHYMERYFPEKRVRYISLLDGIDTGVESSANDITPFRAIMNDMYAKDISKKIKSVKRDKQRKGQFIGGKPVYGYKMHPTEKNKIVIDEEVAPIVRRIFHMALEGMSCRQIATQLNEEGVPTPATYAGLPVANPGPYTGLWSSERISDMLQNETYIGNMVQGRTVKISYKSKKCLKQDRENWVVVEPVRALIQKPVQNSSARPKGPHTTPLTALFTCVIISTILSFPPIHKTKADRTRQRLCPQNSERSHFPPPGRAAFPAAPHCAKTMALSFCLRDTAAFPCGLTPSAPAALKRRLLQSARTLPAVHVFFSSSGAQLCAIERLYHILSLCARHFIYHMLLFHLLCRQMNFILV